MNCMSLTHKYAQGAHQDIFCSPRHLASMLVSWLISIPGNLCPSPFEKYARASRCLARHTVKNLTPSQRINIDCSSCFVWQHPLQFVCHWTLGLYRSRQCQGRYQSTVKLNVFNMAVLLVKACISQSEVHNLLLHNPLLQGPLICVWRWHRFDTQAASFSFAGYFIIVAINACCSYIPLHSHSAVDAAWQRVFSSSYQE